MSLRYTEPCTIHRSAWWHGSLPRLIYGLGSRQHSELHSWPCLRPSNQMGQIEGDLEKRVADGAGESLKVIALAAADRLTLSMMLTAIAANAKNPMAIATKNPIALTMLVLDAY